MDTLKYQEPGCFRHKISIYGLLWLSAIIFSVMPSTSNALSVQRHSECITKYERQLTKGGFSGGFFCDNGTTFERIKSDNKNYIIYYYIYKFKAAVVFHGGQRIIFFNRKHEYLGQFAISTTPDPVILPKKDKLVLMVDKKPICEIFLSFPPQSTFCEDKVDFFK